MENNKVKKNALLTAEFILACLCAFGIRLATQVRSTSLPLFVIDLGYNKSAAGLAVSAYTITAMLLRPVAGIVVDRFGRKRTLLLGLILMTGSIAPIAFAKNVTLIYLLAIITGVGFSFQSTSLSTVITDLVPDEKLSAGLGYYSITSTLSQAFGPSVALAVIGNDDNYKAGFFTATVFGLIGILLALFLNYEKKRNDLRPAQKKKDDESFPVDGEKRPWWAVLAEPTALKASFIICFICFCSTGIGTFMTTYGKENNIERIGLFFTFKAIATGISRLMTGTITEKLGNTKTMKVSLFMLIGGYVGLFISKSLFWLCVFGFIDAFGNGVFNVACNVMALVATPKERRGAANSTYYLLMDMGIGIGSAFWGVIADWFGTKSVFLGCGIVCTIIAIYVYITYRNDDNELTQA